MAVKVRTLTGEEAQELIRVAHARTASHRLVQRARSSELLPRGGKSRPSLSTPSYRSPRARSGSASRPGAECGSASSVGSSRLQCP